MPFVFVIIGLLLLVVAIRGTQNDAFTLLKSEFVGAHSFLPWAASILILGAIGYARPVKPVADALILLVVLVILLKNGGGFFARLNDAIAHPTAPSQSAATAPASAPLSIQTPFGGMNVPTVTTPQGQVVPVPDIQTPWAPGAF